MGWKVTSIVLMLAFAYQVTRLVFPSKEETDATLDMRIVWAFILICLSMASMGME